tara:strand:- start:2491 stop:3270 length:780 start_codon:yes stop_codon:yes gene_type:complete
MNKYNINFELDEFDFRTLADLKKHTTICINGSSGSGKNHWAQEAIYWLNRSKKGGRFKHAFLFSATAHLQDSFPFIPTENRYTTLDNLDEIIRIRKETQNTNESILIVLDDFAVMKSKGKMVKNSEALTGITFFRHLSISCVMLTHRDTQLHPIMRNSCGIVVNFLPKTKQDQKSIRERYLSIGSTKQEVETIYHQVFSQKYRALVCEQYKNATTLKEYCSVSTAPAKLRKYKLSLIPMKEEKKKDKKKKSKHRIYAEV